MPGKKTRIWLCLFAGAVIAAAFAFWHFWDGAYLAGRIAAAARHGGQLEIRNKPVLSLFPPTLTFGDIAWQGDIGGIHIVFTAAGGRIEINLPAFLGGRVLLEEMNLNSPAIVISPAVRASGANNPHNPVSVPEIERLVASNGSLRLETEAGTLILESLRIAIQNLRPRQESELQCDFVLNWQSSHSTRISGNFALRAGARYYAPNIIFRNAAATFTATGRGLFSSFSPFHVQFDGALDLEALKAKIHAATLRARELELKGAGEYAGGRFMGKSAIDGNLKAFLPVAADFSLQARMVLTAQSLQLENAVIELGGSQGAGNGRFVFPSVDNPGEIDISLNMEKLDLAGFALPEPDQAKKARRTEIPEDSRLRLNANLFFDNVKAGNFELSKLGMNIAGAPDRYRLEKLAGGWANGAITATGDADFNNLNFALAVAGRRISLGAGLKQLGINGFVNGPADFDFSLRSKGANLMAAISGAGKLECRNLEIEPLGEIALLLPLLGRAGRQIPTVLRNINFAFSAADGVATFAPILATSPNFHGSGNAALNFKTDSVKGDLVLRTPGLDLPVAFSGPFDEIGWRIAPELLKGAQGD